jgi:hypothetical protein
MTPLDAGSPRVGNISSSSTNPDQSPDAETALPAIKTFQFGVADLMVLTFCIAVGAWLVSIEQWVFVAIWVGTVFGWVIGKGSDYPTVLTSICGSVLGLAIVIASIITTTIYYQPLIGGASGVIPLACCSAAWAVVVGIFLWLCFRVGRSRPEGRRENDGQQKSPLI